MAGRRFWYLACLAGCLVFYIFYREWVSFLLLVAAIALPWFSLALSLPAMLTTRVRVSCPASVPMEEEARVRLLAASRFPTPPVRARIRVLRPASGTWWKLRYLTVLPTEHCGGLICRPEKVWVYDYLGLFRHRIRHPEPGTTAVLPRPVPMGAVFRNRPPIPTRYRPRPGGGFAENHDLRLYRPGDDLRQIHWKMSAKTGKLILREPLEPIRGRILVTLDLSGTDDALDRKLGRLLWLGRQLLEQGAAYEIHALTGDGIRIWPVRDEKALSGALNQLLFLPPAAEGSITDSPIPAFRRFHIGGEDDEAD